MIPFFSINTKDTQLPCVFEKKKKKKILWELSRMRQKMPEVVEVRVE